MRQVWAVKWFAAALLAGLAPSALCAQHGATRSAAPGEQKLAGAALEQAITAFREAQGDDVLPAATAYLDILARNAATIGDDAFFDAQTALATKLRGRTEDPALIAAVRAHIERRIAGFAARGDALAELRFRTLEIPLASADEQLGNARAIHRRAAELGLLRSTPARGARSVIADRSFDLVEEGRVGEALRALDDTFGELDAAGMHLADTELARAYAEALTLAHRDAEADALFGELIAYWQNQPPPLRNERKVELLYNQASYFRNLARRFAAAEEPGRIAADMAERLFGRDAISTQKSRYNYALALLGQGKAAEALPYFEEALPLQLAAEDSRFSGTQAKADTIILLTTLARARAQVPGHELAALDAAEDAANRLRARQKDRLARQEKADPATAALARAMSNGNRHDPLSQAYDMVLFAGWAARDAGMRPLDAAFRAAQDLTLNDAGNAISEAAARDIAGSGPLGALVRERQDVAAALVSGTRAYRMDSLGSSGDAARAQKQDLDRLAMKLAGLDARLEKDFPEYNALVAPRSITVLELQAALAPDEALLLMLPSEGSHYIFAISATTAKWHRIDGGAADIGALVGRIKCRIDEATCDMAELDAVDLAGTRGAPSPIDDYFPRFDRGAAYRLYQMLIAPVADVLPEGGRVYTVASGPIAALPLAMLVASPPQGDPESGEASDLANTDWLSRHMAFITLPSVSALQLAQHSDQPGVGEAGRPLLVAYGAPELTGKGAAANRGGGAGAGAGDVAGTRRRRGGAGVRAANLTWADGDRTMASVEKLRALDPLPGTVVELRNLANDISRGQGLHLGKDATESAVKADRELPLADTVVFATHGLLPGEMGVGSEPGLVLTPPAVATVQDDGLLTASEAAGLSLSARWVVLSACNTATPVGSESGGESLSSLARSFLYAGARNLLASHWRVADDATAALTVETLANRSLSPSRALAAAMEAVRTGRRADGSAVQGWQPHWAHPASWAPFTLITNRDR
ncbi:MAG: CHAT domain-containing protein [Sphingomonadales bacterium]|nr:CHAT domain-containing protein [Sphingomonadales bacterium]MBD3772514.1 CHAT domain-containing protein [Paracoccaceae bacterium]